MNTHLKKHLPYALVLLATLVLVACPVPDLEIVQLPHPPAAEVKQAIQQFFVDVDAALSGGTGAGTAGDPRFSQNKTLKLVRSSPSVPYTDDYTFGYFSTGSY